MSYMKFTRLLLVLYIILLSADVFAGSIHTGSGNNNVQFGSVPFRSLNVTMNVCRLDFRDVMTRQGAFTELFSEDLGFSNVVGYPKLPVYHKLIQVPLGAEYDISIISSHFTEVRLSDLGVVSSVIPAQAPLSKHITDLSLLPFEMNPVAYLQNSFSDAPLVSVAYVGIMRAVALARLDISPVRYNPVSGMLRIYDHLEARITFRHPDLEASNRLLAKYSSPWYQSLYSRIPNYTKAADSLQSSSPATYVIIAPPCFKNVLSRFIAWKTRKGFRVIAGYTDDPLVGSSRATIKDYLQGLYENPPAGYNAPSFVLFAGDVDKIPAYNTNGHPSDMYYCEYTNDHIPEVTYGRFAAGDTVQMNAYIDKTLEYEKYTMPSDDFLGEAVMVAGADPNCGPLYGNGQINYGTSNYFNTTHGILSHTYLQPEMVPGTYGPAIHTNVSDGVAFANYTAHGSEGGWADPSFGINDIAPLQNAHKYCLMVGNCCKTSNFAVSCFAKEVTRATGKGALGYIGCSDYSYWDEDFWWACGFKTVSTNPVYDSAHLGSYDKTFHDHGEPLPDYFVTMGQMVQAGDYAVEESSSGIKLYYWETYCLMGDPSLCVYYSVPTALQAEFPHLVLPGTSSLAVTTEPLSYVAISLNDSTLLDARTVDSSGLAVLSFPAVSSPCYARLIITKQNRKPLVDSVEFHDFPAGIAGGNAGHIEIYPNPFTDKFSVVCNSGKAEVISLGVYDIYGNCLITEDKQFSKTSQAMMIDGSRLSPGIYFCRIQGGSWSGIRKVIKEK
ncbi:MAG: C25 family cysteine peptidase [Bacteroidota bacterium]